MNLRRMSAAVICLTLLSCSKKVEQEPQEFSSSLSDDVSLCKVGEEKAVLFKRFPHGIIPSQGIRIENISAGTVQKYIEMSVLFWRKESDIYATEDFQKESWEGFRSLFRKHLSRYDNDSKIDEVEHLSSMLNYYLTSSVNLYMLSGDVKYLEQALSDLLDEQDSEIFDGYKRRSDYVFKHLFDLCVECNGALSSSPIYYDAFRALLNNSYRQHRSIWVIIPVILSQNGKANYNISKDYFVKIMRADSMTGGFLYRSRLDKKGHPRKPITSGMFDQMYKTGYALNLIEHGVCHPRDAAFVWPYTLNKVPDTKPLVSEEVAQFSRIIFLKSDIRN